MTDNEIEEIEELEGSFVDQNTSFLSSLNDQELIEFICKLSQEKKRREINQNDNKNFLSDLDKVPDVPNITKSSNEVAIEDDELPFQLAQEQNDSSDNDSSQVFGDYRSYFQTKSKNQQKMDEDYINWEKERQQNSNNFTNEISNIFEGCVIHVNGHTNPNIHTLHKLIILNGGKFLHHLSSKGQITHIVAERLTPRKEIEFKNYKVVKPEWLLDSIKVGKIVDWMDYSVIGVGYGQKRLKFTRQEKEIEEQEELNDEPEIEQNFNLAIDSKHPDFLKAFFEKSRLHHLSLWKSDLRYEFFQKIKLKTSHKPFKNSSNFKIILHIDFDSFFAKVSSLLNPKYDFETQPVCVSHATGDLKTSTADISSCNYIARRFGVRNGMWVSSAIEKCPNLICLNYEFNEYEKISRLFYDTLIEIGADSIYPVSVDEALLDISSLFSENGADLINNLNRFCQDLKSKIFQKTKCIVSIGCSKNVLLARLSLKQSKPNGIFIQLNDDVQDWINEFNIIELPGIGRSIEFKIFNHLLSKDLIHKDLTNLKINELNKLSKLELQNLLGNKNGLKLYQYSKGVDSTSLTVKASEFSKKSISIDINWGIRFNKIEEIDEFIFRICENLSIKLKKFKLLTEQLTLKILKRAKGEPIEPIKYLGCGKCDGFSKLTNLGVPTNDFNIIGNEIRSLYRFLGCEPKELRGIGVIYSKLAEQSKIGNQQRLNFNKISEIRNQLDKKLESPKKEINSSFTQLEIPTELESSILKELPSSIKKQIRVQQEQASKSIEVLPSQIDLNILKELPKDIQDELKVELRRRNLTSNISPKKSNYFIQQIFPVKDNESKFLKILKKSSQSPKKSPSKKSPDKHSPNKQSPNRGINGIELIQSPSKKRIIKTDLNLDPNVLNELPEELRNDIIKQYEEYQENTGISKRRLDFNEENNKRIKYGGEYDVLEKERDFSLILEKELNLSFQKKSKIKDILRLINAWIYNTIDNGPNEKDVLLFKKYVNSLDEDTDFLFNKRIYYKQLILQELNKLLIVEKGLCEIWKEILQDLIE